jgi:lysophospholipase L1-like esterase
MAAIATRAGVEVYLATLPPWNPEGSRGDNAALVPALNAAIVRVAARRGVELVDLHAAFGGDLTLIAPDGLHPNQAGYQRMADTFFEAIKRTLEVAPGATSSGSTSFPLRRRR